MANIFSNAYLTIAASAAKNGQQGLLNRRSTRKLESTYNGTNFTVCIRDEMQHEFQDNALVPFVHDTDLTLRERAWCLQEELLSRKMIHFTWDEIVFVCCEATACECKPYWVHRFMSLSDITSRFCTPRQMWGNIIEHYTARRISFCKDRLPALSSLTHLFQTDSDGYFAGLWESHMPTGLLWCSENGSRPESHGDPHSNPPSWSWASIEGKVWVHEPPGSGVGDGEEVAEVLDVRTYPSTNDPRGMISGGHITLRAPLFPLEGTWKRYAATMEKSILGSKDSCDRFHVSCSPGWPRYVQWSEEDACCCLLDDQVKPPLLLPNGVIGVPIVFLVIRKTLHVLKKRLEFHGLLLKPLDDLNQIQTRTVADLESKLAFVRIGMGLMELDRQDAEDALNRFKKTTVTIF